MGTKLERDSWLIDSSESFLMSPHRDWLYEYEELEGGDVLLGDYSLTNIVGWGKVWLILKIGRRGTLPRVFHIIDLARNIIYVSRMSDAIVNTVFEKDTWKMVWGEMVWMRGINIRTLYKLLGRTNTNSYYHIVVHEIHKISSFVVDSTMLWH